MLPMPPSQRNKVFLKHTEPACFCAQHLAETFGRQVELRKTAVIKVNWGCGVVLLCAEAFEVQMCQLRAHCSSCDV